MATSGKSEAGFKQSRESGNCQGSEPVFLEKSSVETISRGLEATSLKQTTITGISSIVEAGAVKLPFKGVGTFPASERPILEQPSKALNATQVVKAATWKQPSKGAVTSPLSDAGVYKIPVLKQASRGVGSSQTSEADLLQSPTLKHAPGVGGISESLKADTLDSNTLKHAPRGKSISQASDMATSKQSSREESEAGYSETLLKAVISNQLSEIDTLKGDGASQMLDANNLKHSPRGMDMSQATGVGSLKQLSVIVTSTPSACCTSEAAEGRSTGSSEVGSSKQNKGMPEQEKEGRWDASLPTSSSLSPHNSVDRTSVITGASSVKHSTSAKLSDGTNSAANSVSKTSGSAKVSERGDFVESAKSSVCRGSNSSGVSDESTCSSLSSSANKPHKANDSRWEAIRAVRMRDGILGLSHFRLLKRLGCGDIGSVYLSELSGTRCYFAMKVMDKGSLASRKKLLRAQTEREILQSLDHPFLPTLYTHFETDKFSCLVMEYCPGGDLHTLRQRQPGKHFTEQAVRFYVAEVLLSLEYLHMLGIVYRDLKPENVLVREDGHIMLSDFDLSLRCAVSPTLVKSASVDVDLSKKIPAYCVQPACIEPSCVQPVCVQPSCVQPTCFVPRFFPNRSKKVRKPKNEVGNQVTPLPELIAEPTSARSMSFVGTHEYLAPEIIKGEGHGSAVDWWTFGIFLYELLFGKTPFKGSGNRATLFNVVGQPLRFPESPTVSFAARDLIRGLLVKEPQHRLAFKRGATEIKQHPFFEGVNWALIRCTTPPEIPKPLDTDLLGKTMPAASTSEKKIADVDSKSGGNYLDFDFF
eukprot:Gb_30532 [translate_table: standard]